MAKASKTFVDWLRKGERGWVDDWDWHWKWTGKRMLGRVGKQPWGSYPMLTPKDRADCTEVYPRPAPRRKVKAVRSAVSWAVLDPWGKPYGARPTRDGATRLKERDDDTVVRCTINYSYTPKKGRK